MPRLPAPLPVPVVLPDPPDAAPSALAHLRLLTWWDALLLFTYFLDTFGDFLAQGVMILFLSDNLHASDATAAGIKVAMIVFEAGLNFFLGRILDTWPRDAPLTALTYLKPVGATALLGLVAVDVTMAETAWMAPETALVLALVILTTLFAPSEAFGAQAFALEADRRAEVPGDALLQTLLTWGYGVMNAGAASAALVVLLWRNVYEDRAAMANRAVLCTAAGLYLAAAVVAHVAHKQLVAHCLVVPHISKRHDPWAAVEPPEAEPIVDLDDEERPPLYFATSEHPDDQWDPCAWDCSTTSCRQASSAFRTPRMRRYMAVLAAFVGISWLYVQQDDTLPKYMIRRFDEAEGRCARLCALSFMLLL